MDQDSSSSSSSSNRSIRSTPEQQLFAAVRARDCSAVLRALLSAPPTVKININVKAGRHQRSPLHYAACKGDLEIVLLLLRLGASLESRDYAGNTPLQIAVFFGHKNVRSQGAVGSRCGRGNNKRQQNGAFDVCMPTPRLGHGFTAD